MNSETGVHVPDEETLERLVDAIDDAHAEIYISLKPKALRYMAARVYERLPLKMRAAAELIEALDNLIDQADMAMKAEGGEGYWAVQEARAILAAIAMEARRAETTEIGSVHEGAGRKASPNPSQYPQEKSRER